MDRRSFLQSAGAAAPTLQLVAAEADERFTPIRLETLYNASARDFGPRPAARGLNPPEVDDSLIHTLGGERRLRGLPFQLGPADVSRKSWAVLSTRVLPWTAPAVEIPIGRTARFLCLASFCDWEAAEFDPADIDAIESVGGLLAEAVLIYEDGASRSFPVRRRFEVGPPAGSWGRECFNAVQSNTWQGVRLDAPLKRGTDWGHLQQAALPDQPSRTVLWLWALENPSPDSAVKALRLESRSEDYLAVCGLTLYHGRENPLRYERRRLYRITLPSTAAAGPNRWKVETDLGVVCRTFTGSQFDPGQWLGATAGVGEPRRPPDPLHLYAEVTCSNEATLALVDTAGGARYEFDLAALVPGKELAARQGSSRVEVLETRKTWLHGRIVDGATGRPVPARIAFRSPDGRYIPPYGHRTEINPGWFQDYGADVLVGAAPFAYVDGTFQVELPAGEVYVEVNKGFEYEAARRKIEIAPGQRELELRINRVADWRKNGWVTADTHVHFLSPSTAVLEAQAEGLNLVNLLAAQWGDLYTNVGDLPHGPLISPDRETLVSVGTENRQHLLGHLGLLGGHGEPVFPLSADGPSEAYPGDPLWACMSDWADACRRREGLVVAVHFPMPNAEMAAEIVLGKVDAVELYPRGDGTFRALAYQDWYRYLNCGYRVAAAGGTDKMGATTPVGGNRTYACLEGREFSFANWAAAVRAGRTFATTGPLLDFRVEGKMPGGEIRLGSGGGTVEVRIEASSYVPFHRLEVVRNGRVAASREDAAGTRQMAFSEKIAVEGPGWLAARCGSRIGAAGFGVAAHTSPVYVSVPGREVFSGPAAAYFLHLIEGTETYVRNLATRPDPSQAERIAAVLREARERLQSRFDKNRGA